MNYYEELGVSQSASTEEIRRAYKALARLVHPDQCADEKLRGLAEIQMKRLNEILATLANPEDRRRYDAALATGSEDAWRRVLDGDAGRRQARWFRLDRAAWPWLATAAVGLAALIYYFRPTGAPQTPVRSERVAAEAKNTGAPRPVAGPDLNRAPREALERIPEPPLELRGLRRELDEVRERKKALKQEAAGAARVPAPAAPAEAERPEPVRPAGMEAPPVQAPAPAPALDPAKSFAGNWFYVPAIARSTTSGLYPPEYIELRLAEEGGVVRGRYRARYRVTDQAISPVVAFQFEGPGKAPAARVPWRGPGGAGGEIRLTLVSESALEVKWTAHHISDDLSLTSGTAMLIRQRER
jgi:hypothetical protein